MPSPYYQDAPFATNQWQANQYSNPYRFYNTPNTWNAMQQPISVPKVHGEEGARLYPFTNPNSSMLLLDDTNPIVWLRVNNELGHPTISGYAIVPLTQQSQETQPETAKEADISKADQDDDRFAEYERRLDELERKMRNGKSDSSGNGRNSGSGNQQRSGSKSQ